VLVTLYDVVIVVPLLVERLVKGKRAGTAAEGGRKVSEARIRGHDLDDEKLAARRGS
jgi:hypothetical protein